MGVWGAGNFDGDLPRDFLADMVYRWEQLIEVLIAGEMPPEAADYRFDLHLDTCEACVMPMVEVIIAVAERLRPDYLPGPATAEKWKAEYLGLFDREADSWDAGSQHTIERRSVIEATFNRLLDIVRLQGGGEPSPESGEEGGRPSE